MPRHHSEIRLLPQGFFGAVQDSTVSMKHDFAFFAPYHSLEHPCYEFSPANSVEHFVATARRRWGGEFRHSRTALEDLPNLFVRQAQCRFVIYAGEWHTAMNSLPPGTFSVVAHHDRLLTDEIGDFFGGFEAVRKFEN